MDEPVAPSPDDASQQYIEYTDPLTFCNKDRAFVFDTEDEARRATYTTNLRLHCERTGTCYEIEPA